MGFTKLFSEIVTSSIWNEDDKTRIVWITLLALKGANNIAPASVGGLAHQARVSMDDCVRAIEVLSSPDTDDRSGLHEGRRIEQVQGGFLILNGERYKQRRDEYDRLEYQRVYHREYRRKQKSLRSLREEPQTSESLRKHPESLRKQEEVCESLRKHSLPMETRKLSSTFVNSSKPASTQSDTEEEEEEDIELHRNGVQGKGNGKQSEFFAESPDGDSGHASTKVVPRRGPLCSAKDIEDLQKNPAYSALDVVKEAWKFKNWCETNKKATTLKRFINWLNRVS